MKKGYAIVAIAGIAMLTHRLQMIILQTHTPAHIVEAGDVLIVSKEGIMLTKIIDWNNQYDIGDIFEGYTIVDIEISGELARLWLGGKAA